MENKDFVTIPLGLYLDLLTSDYDLNRLEANGVDNWDGYGEIYDEESDIETILTMVSSCMSHFKNNKEVQDKIKKHFYKIYDYEEILDIPYILDNDNV